MLAANAAFYFQMKTVERNALPGSAHAIEAQALLYVHRDKVLAGFGDSPTVGRNYRVVSDNSGRLYHALPIADAGASAQPVFWMELDPATGAGTLGRVGSEVVATMEGGSRGR